MFELVSKKQMAISNAIDGKAVHEDVAELLESMTGNIQLEVAKKIVEQETQIIQVQEQTETAEPEEMGDPSIPEFETIEPSPGYSEELWALRQALFVKRKRKEVVSENQLSLF